MVCVVAVHRCPAHLSPWPIDAIYTLFDGSACVELHDASYMILVYMCFVLRITRSLLVLAYVTFSRCKYDPGKYKLFYPLNAGAVFGSCSIIERCAPYVRPPILTPRLPLPPPLFAADEC